MASLQQILPGGFDSATVAPQSSVSDPIPAGVYDVEITGADVKETKNQKGSGLKLEYTVVSPATFEGRKVFQFLNLKHENQQAEQIGQSQLSALCRAVGIGRLDDSDQLFGKILRVRVRIRPPANGYEASNDISSYEQAGSAMSLPPATSAMPASHQAKAAAAAPWLAKK